MMRLLALVLWLIPLALRAEDYPALHDVVDVAATDVLNIRAAPDAGAAIIGTLSPTATGIEVIAVIDGWAVVNAEDGSGYAALRFLARSDAPHWSTLETPLTCLGTEPFWSLEIDPAGNETRFQTPEDTASRIAPLDARWPALPWSATAAVGLPDGLAVLMPADCSDGMSDRRYGVAVDVFLTGPDRARLSGCCRLQPP